MSEQDKQLLRCPFCGKHPHIVYGSMGIVAGCKTKHCAIFGPYVDIEKWNRRTPQAQLTDEVMDECWRETMQSCNDEEFVFDVFAKAIAARCGDEQLRQQRDELLKACEKTIEENLELADGDVCTLIDIKRAVERCKP